MRIVVTGATGFIGQPLVTRLRERGDAITVLSRDPARARDRLGVDAIEADLETPGAWIAALAGCDTIIHLAGEPIGGARWTARQKQIIRDSRVEATRTMVEALAALPATGRPRALICASGVDFYPFAADNDYDDDPVTEADPPGESFLARVCRDWEREAFAAEPLGVRVVAMRTGLVIGPGGAIGKMTSPFKLFVGGRIGHGRQWTSWIDREDVLGAYVAAATDDRYRGPINLVTDSIRNADFAKALGAALGKPSWLPVPGLALRAATGELAAYILNGRRVVPERLRALGFTWQRPALADALAAAISS
jgi:uncharacterized protein (TIGR01777 family)